MFLQSVLCVKHYCGGMVMDCRTSYKVFLRWSHDCRKVCESFIGLFRRQCGRHFQITEWGHINPRRSHGRVYEALKSIWYITENMLTSNKYASHRFAWSIFVQCLHATVPVKLSGVLSVKYINMWLSDKQQQRIVWKLSTSGQKPSSY